MYVVDRDLYDVVLVGIFVAAAVVLLLLCFVSAPYGRHSRKGWGPTISTRLAWVVMESPAVVAFVVFFAYGRHAWSVTPLVLLGLWQLHYVHRTLVYPFRLRGATERQTPVAVLAMALCFNVANAFVNATWLSEHGSYGASWLADPRFIAGVALFGAGYGINRWADAALRRLRQPGESSYQIPRGGLYELISCPNYLGEILEWFGWALATWSLAGLAFAAFTVANLLPRAVSHHRWYREQFPDYPEQRRALVPFLL
jgi:protein-S-isoprenylcysteine O-methyltransferase Ste14